MRALLPSLLLSILALDAQAAPPIPPGHEAEVKHLVAAERPAGGEVLAIRIGPHSIEVDLATPDGPTTLMLEAHHAGSKAPEVGRSKSFIVRRKVGPDGDGARRVTSSFVEGLQARDDGTFFSSIVRSAPPEKRAPASSSVSSLDVASLDSLKRALSWAGLVVCLLLLTRGTQVNRRQTLGLVALLLLAWGLRLWLPPQAPLHANAHGVAELRGLIGAPSPWHAADESTRYGAAFKHFSRAVLGWTGAGTDGFFRLNALLSALGVCAAFAFARSLTGSQVVGWAAAVATAVHPANVRIGSSESPMPLAILLTLIALAAWDAALKREESKGRTRLLGLTGGLALALASELAVTTLSLAAAGVLYVLVTGPWRRLRRLLVPVTLVSFTALFHFWVLWPVLNEARIDRGSTFVPFWQVWLGDANLLFNPSLVSPLLLPLAAWGLAALAKRGQWRAALGLALAELVVLAASFPVFYARTDQLRYQILAHALLLVAAGAAALPFTRVSRGRQLVGAGAVMALIVLGSLPGLASVGTPMLDDSAFLAVKEAARVMPKEVSVVITPRVRGEPFMDFPDYLLEEAGIAVTLVEERSQATGACFVHVAAGCWAFNHDEVKDAIATGPRFDGDPIQPRCADRLQGVVPPAPTARQVEVPWREGEFYEVPALKPWVGLFPCGHR